MKPLGVEINMAGSMSVTHPSKVEDAIWDAVEEAINAGWTPRQFKNEIAAAWVERLKQDARDADRILSETFN